MITVIGACYNEIRFVEAWLTCMRQFADEIIVADTGSTDGSLNYFRKQKDVKIISWYRLGWPLWNQNGNEFRCRTHLRNLANGEWIVTIDMDELVDWRFVEFVKGLPDSASERKIVRFPELMFWGNMETLRVRSLWPPISRLPNGKFRILRQWRGVTGCKRVHAFKNEPQIQYNNVSEHTMVQDGRGRLTYRDKEVTLDSGIPIYHYHFAFPAKSKKENRYEQRLQKVRTDLYAGTHPKEIVLIKQ